MGRKIRTKKLMVKIYLVYAHYSDYESEENKNLKAFMDKDAAEKYAERCHVLNVLNQNLAKRHYAYLNDEWAVNNPLPGFPCYAHFVTPAIREDVFAKREIWYLERKQAGIQWLIDNGVPESEANNWQSHYSDYEYLIEEIELEDLMDSSASGYFCKGINVFRQKLMESFPGA